MNHQVRGGLPSPETARAELQRIFGYSSFRSPQDKIVECLLAQRDAMIVLPTGGGKSICFQLPALMQEGLTLVISPLVALMENQVQELCQRNLPAALLHSQVSKSQYQKTLWAISNQKLRLLYLSPETLLSLSVWNILCKPEVKINTLVIDEAHCLVQWGETFRPAYYRLGAVRRALLTHKPEGAKIAIAAFTATADPAAQETIQRILELENPQCFRLNPYRPNLNLSVETVWTPRQRQKRLLKFIQAQNNQAGLVYVRTRRDTEELAAWLAQEKMTTTFYHAGLSAEERRSVEQDWLNGRLQFVVCTNAFGMGINKGNVRWIAHFQAPMLLSEFVQEVGRAGRDGEPAQALMLISEPTGLLDSEDKQRWQFFEKQAHKQQQAAMKLISKLPSQGEMAIVSKQFKGSAIALSLLHSIHCLRWSDPFHYTLINQSPKVKLGQANYQAGHQMKQYLKTRNCRWQFLLTGFGFTTEAENFHCGHCDNCQNSNKEAARRNKK